MCPVGEAGLAEPTFSNSALLMGDPAGDAEIYHKARIFFFADILLVKLSISIPQSNVIKPQVKKKINVKQ